MKKTIVATSGYFDPLHVGHLECFELSKNLAGKNGKLIVIINNDKQAAMKKNFVFMPAEERAKIVKALKPVDEVFISIDFDSTVCKSLEFLKPNIFTKGGDRFSSEIPEAEICRKLGIKMVDGLGAKIQSSSWLIKKANDNGK
jgi:D-beta-D-heptose 7-phosphate kinase/D-beta-D-heptose 1-phosphate adenosyltransferase